MTLSKTPEKAQARSTRKKAAKPTTSPKTSAVKKKNTPPSPAKQTVESADQQNKNNTVQPTAPASGEKAQIQTRNEKTESKQKSPFSEKELKAFYDAMIRLRGHLTVQVSGRREQSLMRYDEVNQYEDGTDAFDRATNLDRASLDQSRINHINTAIKMIGEGTYGLCELCGEKIEKPRLEALPFVKSCIKCQAAMESETSRRKPSIDLLD